MVESPALYDRFAKPWGDNTHGLDMEPARRIVTNRWGRVSAKREEILLPPQTWATLDYTRIADADVSGEASWIAGKSGTAHGLFVWFDAVMGEGAQFTNAPGEPELIYGSAFFPFSQPVALEIGDKVTAAISADLVGGDYVWRWNTVVVAFAKPGANQGGVQAVDFYGTPLSPAEFAGWRRPRSHAGRGRGGRSLHPVAHGRRQFAGNDRQAAGGAVPRPLRELEDGVESRQRVVENIQPPTGRCAIGLKDPQSMPWS